MTYGLTRRLAAELSGSALLLAAVVGSGVMAERLAGGNVALALLGNTLATGAILFVLITALGPVSGAHFNPAVTLALRLRGEIGTRPALLYVLAQLSGALFGVLLAHAMFELTVFSASLKTRTGIAQWLSEAVATFGLVASILATLRAAPDKVAAAVALYITAAYWFTASTSFANPAVTVARSLSDTFSGIAPRDMPPFVAAQLVGATAAAYACRWLLRPEAARSDPTAS